MFLIGEEVQIILHNQIRKGKIYDYKDELGYRVADGPLEEGKFTFSAWREEERIARH